MSKIFEWVKTHALIIIIVLVGFILRIIGIQFGKPFRFHPDELKLVYWAGNMLQYQNWSSDLLFLIGVYPPFFAFLLAIVFGIYSLGLLLFGVVPDFSAVKALYYTDPFQYHLIGRWISAISGTVSIWILYKIGKKLYSPLTAIIAALFLSVSFLHVRNSHYGVVDSLLTLLIIVSFYFSISILTDSRQKNYILAAVFAAMATATKWNAALIIVPLVAAHFLSTEKVVLKKVIDKKLIWAGITAAITFIITCPLPLFDFNEFWGGIVGTARFQQTGTRKLGAGGDFFSYFTGHHSPGYGFFYDNNFVESLGLLTTILFLAGLAYLVWRHKKQDVMVLIFPLIMYIMVGNMQYKAMRHLLPLVPFLLLIAAEFVVSIRLLLKTLVFQRFVLIALVALTAVPIGWKAIQYDLALSQPDTRTIMKEWIEKHIPPNTKIGIEEFHPPLLAEKDQNFDSIRNSPDYQNSYDLFGLVPNMFSHGKQRTKTHDPTNYIIENQISYLVLDSFTFERYHWKNSKKKNPTAVAERDTFYRWVQNNCVQLFRVNQSNKFNISPMLTVYRVKNDSLKYEDPR